LKGKRKTKKTYNGCVDEGKVLKEAAFVAGLEGGDLVGVVRFGGLR